MKKFLSIALTLCLVFAMTSVAFAADKTTPVNLVVSDDSTGGSGSGALATVDVTVPESIVITAQKGTVVATVDDYTIQNNANISYVVLDSLELSAAGNAGWTKEAYNEAKFKNYATGTKKFAMQAKVGEATTYKDLNSKLSSISQNIMHNTTLTVSLQALIPSQSVAIESQQIANLVATISLSTAE